MVQHEPTAEPSGWDTGSAKRCCISAEISRWGFPAALLGIRLPPQRGTGMGSHLLCPILFLHLLPRHYTLSKTWHAQSMSFRASSNFLSQKMVSFIASNNNVLMAFRSMSKKNLISPEMLMRCRALPAQRGGLWYPAAHQGWEAGGKATGNSNVLAEYLQLGTAVGFLLFILFGLLISEDGRKWWDHDTFTASIRDSGMVSH